MHKNCRLLELLKCDEARVPEREAELKAEKEKVAKLRLECPLPWPEVYIKHTEEPKCQEAGVNVRQANRARRVCSLVMRFEYILFVHLEIQETRRTAPANIPRNP